MALSRSPDWSLAWIPCNSTKTSTRTIPLLSVICFYSRDINLIAANSSTCSSPLLEDNASSITKCQPVGLDLQLQNLNLSDPEEDLNIIICSLIKNPQTAEIGCEYYEKAKGNPGFRPKKSTLSLLTRYFMRLRNWSSISSLAQDFRAFNLLPDRSTFCRLISSCVRARKFKNVNSLLEAVIVDEGTAILAFDYAMKGYNKLHMYSSTVMLYQMMKSAGLVLDPGCYCSSMEAYLKMGQPEKVVSLFQDFQQRRVESTPFHAQIYLCLCNSLGKMGRPFDSLEHFREMTRKGVPEDHSFYSSLICSFAAAREVTKAEELLEEAESKKMLKDPALFLKLVLMYIEERALDKTLDIISVMKRVKIRVSDCISCGIVNAFSRKRGPRAAMEVYEELLLQGCEPGQVTYASILNIYCRVGLYTKAEKTFSDMDQKGFDKCTVAYSSMINMYGKTGRQREAMMLFAKMKEKGCEPNVWVYNSLLDIHGRALNLEQVEKIWKEMKMRKVSPDRVSYTSIISAYSKGKKFDKCVEYYHDFKLNRGKIDRAMAGVMVGVFSKMNKVDELVELLQEMKMDDTKLDARLYQSALNALRDSGLEIRAKWLQESFAAT